MEQKIGIEVKPPEPILAGYVTPLQLAAQIGRTLRTLYRWNDLGIGPPRVRVGRLVLYKVVDIRAWLDGRAERQPIRGKLGARRQPGVGRKVLSD